MHNLARNAQPCSNRCRTGALAGIGLIRIAKGEHREALAYRKALAVNPSLNERLELIPAPEKKVGDKPI